MWKIELLRTIILRRKQRVQNNKIIQGIWNGGMGIWTLIWLLLRGNET